MFYEIRTTSSQALLETVWNEYDAEGKTTRVIRKLASQTLYRATRMIYNASKQVEYVIGEQWTPDGQAVPCNQYSRTYVWRYRYDGPRQRYMRQKLDPDNISTVLETSWTLDRPNTLRACRPLRGRRRRAAARQGRDDYDGNEIYTDFHLESPDHLIDRSYEPAFGEYPNPSDSNSSIQHYHRDLIGSTRTMTCDTNLGACTPGPQGEPPITRRRVYTAFGEVVSTSGTQDSRYRYAGSAGYESHDDFPFQHVGARWYDPETGRFLQRDPIGIDDGLNVYEYCHSNPVASVDAEGTWVIYLVRGANLLWRQVLRKQAVKAGQRGVDVCVPGGRGAAKGVAKDVWPGRQIVEHGPHQPAWRPHFQPSPRPVGPANHIFYDVASFLLMAEPVDVEAIRKNHRRFIRWWYE